MNVGSRLKRYRRAKKLRLVDVAQQVGISVSYLSMIENDRVSVSVSTLQDLVAVLEISMVDLFAMNSDENHRIIYKAERKEQTYSNGVSEAFLTFKKDSGLETAIIKFPGNSEIVHKSGHVGEEFTYVLKGSIQFFLEENAYDLEEGDIIYYNSSLAHSWGNSGKEISEILVVNTPSTF